jgi:hypothetical protein
LFTDPPGRAASVHLDLGQMRGLALLSILGSLLALLVDGSVDVGPVFSLSLAAAAIAAAAMTLMLVTGRQLTGVFVSLPLLLLVGLVLCNLGGIVTESLGLAFDLENTEVQQVRSAVESLRNRANLVAAVGALSYAAGLLTAVRPVSEIHTICQEPAHYLRRLRLWALGSWFVFITIFLVQGVQLGLYDAAYGKQTYDKLTLASMQMALSCCVLYGAHADRKIRTGLCLFTLCAVTYSAIAALGLRGQSFAFVYAAFAVWLLASRRIVRFRYIAIGYIIAALMWTVVGQQRNLAPSQREYSNSVSNAVSTVSTTLAYPLLTLTGQEVSLQYAVLYVQEYGIGFGKWYLQLLPYAIPNVSSAARTTGDEGSISSHVSNTYIRSYGIGFTPIAEAYCNFGIIGVSAILYIVGFCLQRMQQWLERSPTSARRVAVGLTIAAVLWWVRNDSMQLGRFILWGLALYGVGRALTLPLWHPRSRGPKAARSAETLQ